ncbi:CotD family spore coat protein [Salipaludibacillus daqingensis]|uniref:CotD family spore coat protein n=1 Tax=Salipaludibacillus daqingensis TaxID=3041001 RepID=UPI0024768EAA|nr:CotD family spore coat protein [Salipaludibacillus daqingensis]
MFNCHHPRPCHKPRPQVLQTQVCPTQQAVRERDCNYVVPVVHPSHTTNVINHRYDFHHSYPHTESRVDRIFNRHFRGPGGPGQVAGAFQPGPGAPGQVAGAFQPGPGQVMGAHHHKPCASTRRGFF